MRGHDEQSHLPSDRDRRDLADGVDAAIQGGLARAAQTMRALDWFEVQSIRGHLVDGAVAHFQVTMKVGFRLEDS